MRGLVSSVVGASVSCCTVRAAAKDLFYDPVLGTFQAGGNVIDSLSQIDPQMSSN